MRHAARLAAISAALAVVALAGGTAAPATGGVQFTTVEQIPIGAPTGTFTASGDITDAGSLRFDSFVSAGPFVPVVTEHIIQTYVGSAGSLTVNQQCLSVFQGTFFTDRCNVVVVDGTGAYEGLRGTAKCDGVINLITGIAARTCDYSLTRP